MPLGIKKKTIGLTYALHAKVSKNNLLKLLSANPFSQDTCVALQALAAYSEATGGDQLNLRITVTTDRDSDYRKTLVINQNNALVQQQLDVSQTRFSRKIT